MKAFFHKLWNRPGLFLLFCIALPFFLVGVVLVMQFFFYWAAGFYEMAWQLCDTFLEWLVSLVLNLNPAPEL